jgi:hypothetical protein
MFQFRILLTRPVKNRRVIIIEIKRSYAHRDCWLRRRDLSAVHLKQTNKVCGVSPRANCKQPSDSRLSATLMQTFAERGCRVVSATNSRFLDRACCAFTLRKDKNKGTVYPSSSSALFQCCNAVRCCSQLRPNMGKFPLYTAKLLFKNQVLCAYKLQDIGLCSLSCS